MTRHRSRMTDPTETLLMECLRYFVHLDNSNAAIHCASVKYSPITFRLAEAIVREFPDGLPAVDIDVRSVLADVGQYKEDRGR